MVEPMEMTLDELREAIAPLLPAHAAFDGWNAEALGMAAAQLGVPADRVRLAFPDGAPGMIDAWFDAIDSAMLLAWPPAKVAELKVRDRIRNLLLFRLETVRPHKEALRRALSILAQPQNAPLAARLAWRTADRMWRLAGDTATDFNHYTKRTILVGVYGSTLLAFLGDDSEDMTETRAFLDRRLAGVMKFEKVKGEWRRARERVPSLSRFLGRLRYPVI